MDRFPVDPVRSGCTTVVVVVVEMNGFPKVLPVSSIALFESVGWFFASKVIFAVGTSKLWLRIWAIEHVICCDFARSHPHEYSWQITVAARKGSQSLFLCIFVTIFEADGLYFDPMTAQKESYDRLFASKIDLGLGADFILSTCPVLPSCASWDFQNSQCPTDPTLLNCSHRVCWGSPQLFFWEVFLAVLSCSVDDVTTTSVTVLLGSWNESKIYWLQVGGKHGREVGVMKWWGRSLASLKPGWLILTPSSFPVCSIQVILFLFLLWRQWLSLCSAAFFVSFVLDSVY